MMYLANCTPPFYILIPTKLFYQCKFSMNRQSVQLSRFFFIQKPLHYSLSTSTRPFHTSIQSHTHTSLPFHHSRLSTQQFSSKPIQLHQQYIDHHSNYSTSPKYFNFTSGNSKTYVNPIKPTCLTKTPITLYTNSPRFLSTHSQNTSKSSLPPPTEHIPNTLIQGSEQHITEQHIAEPTISKRHWLLHTFQAFPEEAIERFPRLSKIRFPTVIFAIFSLYLLSSSIYEGQYFFTEFYLKPKLLRERKSKGDFAFFKLRGFDEDMIAIASDLERPISWTVTKDPVETRRSIQITLLRHLLIAEQLDQLLIESKKFRDSFFKEYAKSKKTHMFILKFLPSQFPVPFVTDATTSRIIRWKNSPRELSHTINSLYYDVFNSNDEKQNWKNDQTHFLNYRLVSNILIPSYYSLYQSKLALRYYSMMQLILKSIFHQEWYKLTGDQLHDPVKVMQYWEKLTYHHYLLQKFAPSTEIDDTIPSSNDAIPKLHKNSGLQLTQDGANSVADLIDHCENILVHSFMGNVVVPVQSMTFTSLEKDGFKTAEPNELLDFAQFPSNLDISDDILLQTNNQQIIDRLQLQELHSGQPSAFDDASIARDFYTSRIHTVYVPTPKLPSIFVE